MLAEPEQQQPLPVIGSPGSRRRVSPGSGGGAIPEEMTSSFVSLDEFLDSVSTSAAVGGTPLASRDAVPMVALLGLDEKLEETTGDSSAASEASAPALFLYEPEPEPEPEGLPPRAPPPPPLNSKAEHSRYARPPSEFSSSGSSSGTDGSTGKPESGGAVFDVVHEVRSPLLAQHRQYVSLDLHGCHRSRSAHSPPLVQGKEISLSVGAMGIQLFDGRRFITSYLYDEMEGGWSFDVEGGPASPSKRAERSVGVVRVKLVNFVDDEVVGMMSNGDWQTGSETLKIFGVLSQRVGKYISLQMDARFGKMVRDRDAQAVAAEGTDQARVCGLEVDDMEDDDSTVFVSHVGTHATPSATT